MNEDAYQLALAQLLQSGRQEPVAPVISQIAPMQMPQYQGPVGGGGESEDAGLANIIGAIGGAAGGIGQASYLSNLSGNATAPDSSGGAPIGQAKQYIEPGTTPGAAKPQTQLGSMMFAGSGSANSPTGVSEVQLPVIQSLKTQSAAAKSSGDLAPRGVSMQGGTPPALDGLGAGLSTDAGIGGGIARSSLGGLGFNLLPYAAQYYGRGGIA